MLSVISWGMMAMASSIDKELMFIQLLVARFIIGICIGLSSSPSAVYSAEIAHPTLRGRISVITSVTIGLGILLIYVMGYFIPVSLMKYILNTSHVCLPFPSFTRFLLSFLPLDTPFLTFTRHSSVSLKQPSKSGSQINIALIIPFQFELKTQLIFIIFAYIICV